VALTLPNIYQTVVEIIAMALYSIKKDVVGFLSLDYISGGNKLPYQFLSFVE
jgi:hypothetical protein